MEGFITPSLALLFSLAKDPKLQLFLDKSAPLTPLAALLNYCTSSKAVLNMDMRILNYSRLHI